MSINRWINNENMVYTYNGCGKKREIVELVGKWMDMERIILQ